MYILYLGMFALTKCIGTDNIVSSIDLYESLWQVATEEVSRWQHL